MAYKEILVYLDPTAESLERLRFAIGLAKVHAARLIGVDVGAASGVEGAESSEVTRQTFEICDRRGRAHGRAGSVRKAGRGRGVHPLRRFDGRPRAGRRGARRRPAWHA